MPLGQTYCPDTLIKNLSSCFKNNKKAIIIAFSKVKEKQQIIDYKQDFKQVIA